MTESIIIALISLAGVAITGYATVSKVTQELHTQNEVQNVKIENLTREVRLHNNFVTRVPILEEKVQVLEREVERLDKRQ